MAGTLGGNDFLDWNIETEPIILAATPAETPPGRAAPPAAAPPGKGYKARKKKNAARYDPLHEKKRVESTRPDKEVARPGGKVVKVKNGSDMGVNAPGVAEELAAKFVEGIRNEKLVPSPEEKRWLKEKQLSERDLVLRWKMKALAAKDGLPVQDSAKSGSKYPNCMTFVLRALGNDSLDFEWEGSAELEHRGVFRKAADIKIRADMEVNPVKKGRPEEDTLRLVDHNARCFACAYEKVKGCYSRHGKWLAEELGSQE
jgi:hypothetical protein